MSGYVASVRLVRASPRLTAGRRTGEIATDLGPAPATDVTIVEAAADRRGWTSRLVERSQAIRDRWSQLTFFLFDPDSWRA